MNIDHLVDEISSIQLNMEKSHKEMLEKEKMKEKLKDIITPSQELEQINKYLYEQAANLVMPRVEALQLGEQRETNRLQRESLQTLQAIEQNTANLFTIVELINQSNEHQDEIISIFSEVLSIAKAKTKNEAESLFKKVMGKITQTVNDGETVAKLVGYATAVYKLAQPIIDKLNP